MGPSKLWLPTLLVTVLLHLHYADAQIERTMRHWRHREEGVCSGSANGPAKVADSDRYNDLRMIYQNCTRVYGNVEISFLNSTIVGNRTLDFLDEIEEVKGYIFIFEIGDIERLSFKKLKIIWGDNLFDNASIYVQMAPSLKVLSMPSLRSIDKGVVNVMSTGLCHIQNKVNPDEILNFDRTRYLPHKNTTAARITKCSKRSAVLRTTCHPTCNGSCWGPGEEDCQIVYRSMCPSYCESRQCYLDTTMNETRCCDSQCVAGCTGPFSSDCTACTNFMQCKDAGTAAQKCKCVEQCTSMRKYNGITGQVEINPEGYYSIDNRHCEKECPVHRLVQDDVCVEHCGPGMHYDPNKGDKICRKCDGPCPKSCKFEKILDAENIHELANCTEIEGYLHMARNTFAKHDLPYNKTMRGLKVEELSILKSVRFISEYLYLAADDSNVQSMDFLENLEFIEGRTPFSGKQSLVISHNHNLQHLGLRKLKKIEKGDVVISMNTDLCYLDSFNWKDIVTGANATVAIAKNRNKIVCAMEEKECHSSCDPAFGCWGPGNGNCRKCNNWLQDGHCVDKCSSRGFFKKEIDGKKTCERCFSECDTCTGPLSTDCLTCRSFKLYTKHGSSVTDLDDELPAEEENKVVSHLLDKDVTVVMLENTLPPSEQQSRFTQLTCVPECSPGNYYVRNGECKRCHRSCYELGCNGPSNEPGPNGCKKCRYAQIDPPVGNASLGAVSRCLYNSDKAHSNSVCLNNDLLDHFVQASPYPDIVDEFVCAPCDDECSTCGSKGTSRLTNKCKCKNFVAIGDFWKMGGGSDHKAVYDERCYAKCKGGMFPDNETIEADVAGVCRLCSPLCDRSSTDENHCTGVHENQCTKCNSNVFSYRQGGNLTCVKNCTVIGLYAYLKDRTCNEVDYEKRDKIHKAAIWIGVSLFLLIFVIIAFFLWRRQKRLSKELEQEKVANNPEMPELIPMDLNGPKMNTQKMFLINKNNLSRSAKQLGSGAFGVVYAGCWMPLSKTGKPTKVPVAIKVVKDPSGRAQSEMLDEATKMSMLRHENLLRIVGVCLSGDDLQLVTLLRPLGNLREFLQKHRGKLSGKELLQYSYQIASGMKYLSDQRVVHRDLAARNVLVKNIQHVEITDFGLAKLIDIGADSVQVGEGKVAIKWLALEALEKQVYNTATDVWAFGVTVWEILTYGESPYTNMTPMAIKDFLVNGQRLEQPSNCNIELYKYLIDCWLPNPDSRPTFAVLKENFYKCCRAPWYFVNDSDKQSTFELDNCSQRGLIEEILDETDFEDPQNYFESEPNTPGCANTGDVFNPIRRMDSVGSQRYAQDPTTRKEFGMADDNYLVPNSHVAEIGATMYTPVVVDESGNSSLVESFGYYNEVKKDADYVNDTQAMKKSIRNSRDDRLSMIEEDEVIEKESCL